VIEMRILIGTCGHCGKTIRRLSNMPLMVECDCYLYCPLCGAEMTPYAPNLTPKTYRAEGDYDPLGEASKSEVTVETLFVCLNHDPPFYSTRKPMEVMLK